MAKVRIGISTYFELENELVGIGTDSPTNTLQALGNIQSSDAKAIGITTLTTYQGFTDTKLSLQGSGGSKQGTTSGEVIVEGTVNVSSGTTYTSGPESLTATDNFTLPGISDDKPSAGTMRFNENLGALEFYTGKEWRAVNSRVDNGTGGRGIIGGGKDPGNNRRTDVGYVNIMSKGNENEFGDLTDDRSGPGGCSNGTRGFMIGGADGTPFSDIIDYCTIQSKGDFIDFGNLTTDNGWGAGSCSSSTRGLHSAWYPHSAIIDYFEMSTLGNALDFGDKSLTVAGSPAALASPTRALWAGGYTPGSPLTSVAVSQIEMVTISNKSNTVNFGDLTMKRGALGGCSNAVRGLFCGGTDWNPGDIGVMNTIDYVTIASAGNATHFGELTVARGFGAATSTQTRALIGGMRYNPAVNNVLDYISMDTGGAAIDFGDLAVARKEVGMTSDSHGGLGGF